MVASGRRGISEPELNKFLETIGFQRVRVRMRCVVRFDLLIILRSLSVVSIAFILICRSSAGTWLFDNRRWLNPKIRSEKQLLTQVSFIT